MMIYKKKAGIETTLDNRIKICYTNNTNKHLRRAQNPFILMVKSSQVKPLDKRVLCYRKGNNMIIIKAGDKYGKLTAIKFSHRDKRTAQCWLFICDCGNKKIIRVNDVKQKKIKSCGCLHNNNGGNSFKHGMIKTRTYKSWASMKQRCFNPNNKDYNNYGGRGIIICDRWLNSFINFYKDMGDKPENKSLDRIDNNGNYTPNNCRWADSKTQNNNKRNSKIY